LCFVCVLISSLCLPLHHHNIHVQPTSLQHWYITSKVLELQPPARQSEQHQHNLIACCGL
jgi:hypothetical protein